MRRAIRSMLCLLVLCGGLSAQTIIKSSGAAGGGASNIGDLGDVTLTSETDGDGLRVNADGDFVNTALFTPTTTDILAARMSGNVKSALETAVAASLLNLDGGFEVVDFRCTAVAGVLTCQDPTAGTGITTLAIKAGANQGSTRLVEFWDSDSVEGYISVTESANQSTAYFDTLRSPAGTWGMGQNILGIGLPNTWSLNFSSTGAGAASWDTGIARDAAGVIRGTDGSTGYGQFYAKSFRANPDGTARPTCDSSARGTYWQTYGGAGVADTVAVCAKDAAEAYDWRTIY